MKPLKLTMQAFGSYGEKAVSIDFARLNQNLFLIAGDTGAGKTTIFDAIVFALYGEASSARNKKDGIELQSQYVDYGTEPFVELSFVEKSKVYIVRRVPRHVRPLKRGSGVKEESEKLSLTMPDGTEYPQKEADDKIKEIVGLTKEQFMQVAMIAQGEFMDLLRAKSNDKKVIFRKLFNTELFQNIVEELKKRKAEKLSEIAKIRTACQTEVGHIVVPERYEEGEEISEWKQQIISADQLSITKMETLLEALEKLCDRLKKDWDSKEQTYQEVSIKRDERRDAYTSAKGLAGAFEQLEEAERSLAECSALEEEIKENEQQIGCIHAAYDIQSLYQRFTDAKETLSNTEKSLKEQQDILPELKQQYQEAAAREEEAKQHRDAELEAYTQTAERVEKASRLFARIKKAKEELMLAIEAELARTRQAREELELQQKKAEQAAQAYQAARQNFVDKNAEYVSKQNAFLDAQAGFLAREKLRPGEPCPVCGSTEHPHPCEISEEHRELTREMIDHLAKEEETLRQEQEQKADEANRAAELLTEKKAILENRMNAADTEHAAAQKAIEILEAERDYATEEEAKAALETASATKEEKEEAYQTAHQAAEKVKKAKENAEVLIERYQAELPGQSEECGKRKAAYEKIMADKDQAEHEWKALVGKYSKEDAVEMQKQVDAHEKKKTLAEGKRESARKTIGEQKRPDLVELEQEKDAAEKELQRIQTELEQYKGEYQTDWNVYQALAPKMEERSMVVQEYDRIDSLYRRLSGKASGAHMDIETFVQRYYLQKVLYAANVRFQDMSAGQYELRMFAEEQAGTSLNQGLDLMVYSTVTGKEREVRTLSGGESFMAALALALGMADQIQEHSAAIHLDMMFIDEGFGSLDEHSRNQAVKVLQQMANGSKLIGIISHVSELKQEIEDQLLVSKDEAGSHVKWQIS